MNAGRVAVVPLLRAGRRRVDALHAMVHVTLASGVVLRISPRHPTADGRSFADLRRGDAIDHATIVDVALVPYAEPYTYDVLPDSDTGTYFAGGVLIGSTLREAAYPASIVANGGDTR